MLYRVFVFPQFRWALGFRFSFLPGFLGKSSYIIFIFIFFRDFFFFLFSDSSAYWGSLEKNLYRAYGNGLGKKLQVWVESF